MTTQSKGRTFFWLAVFAALYAFAGGRWWIPAAAWLAPVFAIRFVRDSQSGWRDILWLWLATAVASVISSYHTTTLHITMQSEVVEPVLFATTALFLVIPFTVDRLYHRRFAQAGPGPFWLTLVYPISFTALDYSSAIGSPLGSWGSLAYSQAGATALLQLTAITGLSGVVFIVSWFASVANYVWESDFQWRRASVGLATFLVTVLAVFGFGFARLAQDPPATQTVQVGGFSLPLNEIGTMIDLFQRGAEEEYNEAFKDLNRRQLEQVRVMAQAGARIVVLQEVAIQGHPDEVNVIQEKAASVAREEGIYLALPVSVSFPDGGFENVVRIFDPNGDIVLEHLKFGGAQFEGSVPGSGELQFVDTPYGRLSAAICWDADFPDVIRQAGAMDVDLLLLPSNDWYAIRSLHPQMATFRAIENGMSIFRQTGNGVSSVIDPYGRVINRVDMFQEDPDAWGGLQMVQVPVGAVETLYPETGDVFGLAALVTFLGFLGAALFNRARWRNRERHTGG